jgi:hypothetical protein
MFDWNVRSLRFGYHRRKTDVKEIFVPCTTPSARNGLALTHAVKREWRVIMDRGGTQENLTLSSASAPTRLRVQRATGSAR